MSSGLGLTTHEIIEGIIQSFQSGAIMPIDAINALGKVLRAKYVPQFKDILKHLFSIDSPMIDVSQWRLISVKALLQILHEMNMIISLKNGKTISRILQFPDEESQFESLARSIVNGKL